MPPPLWNLFHSAFSTFPPALQTDEKYSFKYGFFGKHKWITNKKQIATLAILILYLSLFLRGNILSAV